MYYTTCANCGKEVPCTKNGDYVCECGCSDMNLNDCNSNKSFDVNGDNQETYKK